MNLEKSFLGQESNIAFETKERSIAEKEQVLSDYCLKKNNSIIFVRQGEEKKDDLDLSHGWQKLGGEWTEILEEFLKEAELFLRSPIFTDTFHKDHGTRRTWEANHIDKELEVGLDIKDYYRTNRFNMSRLMLPFAFKSIFEMIEDNSDLDNQLRDKGKMIIEKLNSYFPDNLQEYSNLSDEKKLEIVEKIEPIFKEIVSLLSDK